MTTAIPDNNMLALPYDQMVQDETIDTIIGHDLTQKEELLGQPLIITALTFRDSKYGETEYISVEATTRDKGTVVFNDGSTGVRRELLAYCRSKGWALSDPDVSSDASVLDFEWKPPAKVTTTHDEIEDRQVTTVHVPIRLHCPRGLRVSRYSYRDEKGKEKPAETYHLA